MTKPIILGEPGAVLPCPGGEIRLDGEGTLDEVVVRDVEHFHLEYMADNHVWLRLDRPDGAVVVHLTARGPIEGLAEWEAAPQTEPGSAPDLDRLEALAAAATPGPWKTALGSGDHVQTLVVTEAHPRIAIADCAHDDWLAITPRDHRPNMNFIAEARTAIPALIADVRRLRAGMVGLLADIDSKRWDGTAIGPLFHAGMGSAYEDIAARLRALVEGA